MSYLYLFLIKYWKSFVNLAVIVCLHLVLVSKTNFINWPEMIIYPWFAHKGLQLYKDYIISYPPGSIYILGVFYKIFGYTLNNMKIISMLVLLFSDFLLYKLSLKIFSKNVIAFLITSFFVLWNVLFEGNTIWFETLMLPFYLLSFGWFFDYFKKKDQSKLLLAGLALSIALFIKQTAFYVILVSVLLIIWQNKKSMMSLFKAELTLNLSTAILFIFSVTYFFRYGVLSQYLYWAWIMPFVFTRSDSLYGLLPNRSDILYVVPLYFIFVIFVLLTNSKRSEKVALCGWIIALFFSALPRWGLYRQIPCVAFIILAGGYLIEKMITTIPHTTKNTVLVRGLIFLILVGTLRSVYKFYLFRNHMVPQFFTQEDISQANLIKTLSLHSSYAIFGDRDYLYFILKELPTVKPWIQLFPAMTQVQGIENKLIDSLEANNTKLVAYIPYEADQIFFGGWQPKTLYTYLISHFDLIGKLEPKGYLFKRNNL